MADDTTIQLTRKVVSINGKQSNLPITSPITDGSYSISYQLSLPNGNQRPNTFSLQYLNKPKERPVNERLFSIKFVTVPSNSTLEGGKSVNVEWGWEGKPEPSYLQLFLSTKGDKFDKATPVFMYPLKPSITQVGFRLPERDAQKCYLWIAAFNDKVADLTKEKQEYKPESIISFDRNKSPFSIALSPYSAPKGFNITLQLPAKKTILQGNDTTIIRWNIKSKVNLNSLELSYSTQGEHGQYNVINKVDANDGQIAWKVPNVNTKGCYIGISIEEPFRFFRAFGPFIIQSQQAQTIPFRNQ